MVSEAAIRLVDDLFAFRNLTTDPLEISRELQVIGFNIGDVEANDQLPLEAAIARSIRLACSALEIPITPQQSFTLAKHMRVGAKHYRSGVPLSDAERAIAVRLNNIAFEAYCRREGQPLPTDGSFGARTVKVGEHGLTVGHKIGEASGCFQVVLMILSSIILVVAGYHT